MKSYKSYFDLSIRSYFNMLEEMRQQKDDLSKTAVIIKYLCDLDQSEIDNLPLDEFTSLANNLPDPTTDHTIYKLSDWKGPKKTLVINGEEFEFSPNLTKFSLAQYIDFQMSLGKVETNPEYLLSTILIPKGQKYNDGYSSEDHIRWIAENVSIGLSNQLVNFFIKRYLSSINRTVSYSKAKMIAMSWGTRDKTKKAALKEAIKTQTELLTLTKSILISA